MKKKYYNIVGIDDKSKLYYFVLVRRGTGREIARQLKMGGKNEKSKA